MSENTEKEATRRQRVAESLKSRRFPVRRIIPNMVTLLALCLGLTAVRQGLEGRFELAVMCIVIAGFLDAFDGRLARLLKAESPLGAQLDSLTDFVNFGIAPVLLVYLWALQSTGRLGWAIILVYSVCCALRLARFNVDMEEADRPAWKTRYFIGVPSPSAGGLVMLPIYLQVAEIIDLSEYPSIHPRQYDYCRAVDGLYLANLFGQGTDPYSPRFGAAAHAVYRLYGGDVVHLPLAYPDSHEHCLLRGAAD